MSMSCGTRRRVTWCEGTSCLHLQGRMVMLGVVAYALRTTLRGLRFSQCDYEDYCLRGSEASYLEDCYPLIQVRIFLISLVLTTVNIKN
jgi:hypothetical protein